MPFTEPRIARFSMERMIGSEATGMGLFFFGLAGPCFGNGEATNGFAMS